jgi:uncharacterized damage-inducible protein DinB
MSREELPEPWLRETLREVPAVPRAVLHALQLAGEDIQRCCGQLTDEELRARPLGLTSVGFHIRHIARSLDRLLTYAEGGSLNDRQSAALQTELEVTGKAELLAEFAAALESAAQRIQGLRLSEMEENRFVGRKKLPVTLGGLLVHIADHTQRHVGQTVTTAMLLRNRRG